MCKIFEIDFIIGATKERTTKNTIDSFDFLTRGKFRYEKNISTEQHQARQNPWVLKTDVDKAGKKDYQPKASEGKKTIGRVTS